MGFLLVHQWLMTNVGDGNLDCRMIFLFFCAAWLSIPRFELDIALVIYHDILLGFIRQNFL